MAEPAYDDEDEQSLVQQAVNLAFTPLRLLTSRTAIKAYLSTILFLITSTILLTLSSTAYGFFYYNYIPQINLERVLYLQYDASGGATATGHGQGQHHPYATVALDGGGALIAQQAYDVEVVLDMPRCSTNLGAGNFMLDLALLAPKTVPDALSSWLSNITLREDVLYRSRRPAMLPYASPLLGLTSTVLHLPWHVLGMRDLDREKLVVPMFEMLSFPRTTGSIPTHARLELQARGDEVLRVYAVKLVFRAKFQGLRYWVYNYRVLSYAVFTMAFYGVSVTSMLVGWAVISRLTAGRDGTGRKAIKQEGESPSGTVGIKSESEKGKIKTEDETESSAHGGLSLSNISDTPAQYPTGRGRPPLSFAGRLSTTDPAPEPEEEKHLKTPVGEGEAADDEDEGDFIEEEELRGRAFDSGIGTSMESEHTGLGITRRRSSRGLKR